MKRLAPYLEQSDARGSFMGLTQQQWAEVNFCETAAAQVRGGHYHKHTEELFFIISGKIRIEVENLQTGEHVEFVAQKGDIFVMQPYELHTFRTLRKSQWINMLSSPHNEADPDFHRP